MSGPYNMAIAFYAVIFARIRPRKGAFSMPLPTLHGGCAVVY